MTTSDFFILSGTAPWLAYCVLLIRRSKAWKQQFPALWEQAATPTPAWHRMLGRQACFEQLLLDPGKSDEATAQTMRRMHRWFLIVTVLLVIGFVGSLATRTTGA